MTDELFIASAKQEIAKQNGINEKLKEDYIDALNAYNQIKMVWYAYTLSNYKAMFMIEGTDDYYEATYVKSDRELVIDKYTEVSDGRQN